ncbi:23042_t:CDS:1, partial [Racocetra persica]
PDYSHRITGSDNLFSGIYSQSEGTNVPKLTMNEQSEVNYWEEEIFYSVYRNCSYGFPGNSAS